MLTITDGLSLARALSSPIDPRLKHLFITRRDQLGRDYPLEELAYFAVVQPGDSAADLEAALGFSVYVNQADASRWGEPNFTPGWKWIEDHGWCFEAAWVLCDDGFGYVMIVPKEEGVDLKLLEFFAVYASAGGE